MNEQYSWKRTQEMEIDIADLLRRFCMQWKKAAACALAAAVVLGGLGWLRNRQSRITDVSGIAEEAVLTEPEVQAVTDAVLLQKEIRSLENYLNNSVLMQIDPYQKNRCILLYCIENAKRQELAAITESYLSFITNGGAADELLKSESGRRMDKSCLAELISAYQKTYSSSYLAVVEESEPGSSTSESLFYVEITGRDAAAAQKMALDLRGILKTFSESAIENTGRHRLKLVSSMHNITADSSLQTLQHDKKMLLSGSKTNLKTMTDAFSSEQTAVYKKDAGIEEEGLEEDVNADEVISGGGFRSIIKYILFGLAGGIFVYGGVFSCLYVLRDTVKNTDELKKMYTFPVYGGIVLPHGNVKHDGNVSGARTDACGKTAAQTLNRIRLACHRQGITKLCAAADFLLDTEEKKCLECMAEQFKEMGIDLTVSEDLSADTSVLDSIEENIHVLIICRTGTTTHRMIDDAMYFYQETGIAVAGAMVFTEQ